MGPCDAPHAPRPLLKEMGEVLELGFSDGSNRYDGNKPYPHPHLICIACRNIVDPEVATLSELHHSQNPNCP